MGCAYHVFNIMGDGYFESIYEKCLLIELKKAGLQAKAKNAESEEFGSS